MVVILLRIRLSTNCDNYYLSTMDKILYFVLLIIIQMVQGTAPGTFFWNPRLGVDFDLRQNPRWRPFTTVVRKPNFQNIRSGHVVLIDGYQVGLTIIALIANIDKSKSDPHLNPISAYFYTNAYRWGLRHISLLPTWLSGQGTNYQDTHRVWRKRFYYMDKFVPKWMRYLFPYVTKEEWEKEENEYKRYIKFTEPAFGKHYLYPTKTFRDFRSQQTQETIENLDSSQGH